MTDEIRAHTIESAAKAIEMLEPWRDADKEYQAALDAATKSPSEETMERFHAESENRLEITANAAEFMRLNVFDAPYSVVYDWIEEDFDGLMADLAAIARGDF